MMKTQPDKTNEKQASLGKKMVKEPGPKATATIEDNRPSTVYQRQLRSTMDAHAAAKAAPLQRKAGLELGRSASPELSRRANHTGLPDRLKSGIENLGYSFWRKRLACAHSTLIIGNV